MLQLPDRGHFARDCTVKLCKRCRGRGHEEDKCPSPAEMTSNLAVELPDSDSDSTTSSVAASGFVAIDTAGVGPFQASAMVVIQSVV